MTSGCTHDGGKATRICAHLLDKVQTHYEHFTGSRIERVFLCRACHAPGATYDEITVCEACRRRALEGHSGGTVGQPQIASVDGMGWWVAFGVPYDGPALVTIAPIVGGDLDRWLALGEDGSLVRIDLSVTPLTWRVVAPATLLDPERTVPLTLRVSRDGSLAAVAQTRGTLACVVDLASGEILHRFTRDDDLPDQCNYSIAFAERDGRQLVIHATEWNRLDVIDARTGELLTPRDPTPDHDLDYFHCEITVSPDGRSIVDNGWVWHPAGEVVAWSLDAWLGGNVWESEDGPSRRGLGWRTYYWDEPLCWLDERRVIISGYGNDSTTMIPAARIFDVTTGVEENWFAGPKGSFAADGNVLYAFDGDAITPWDIAQGAQFEKFTRGATAFHPTAKSLVRLGPGEIETIRYRGRDSEAAWARGVVAEIARQIRDAKSWHELTVLGDALERAGCPERAMIEHCHAGEAHGNQCWVIDRIIK